MSGALAVQEIHTHLHACCPARFTWSAFWKNYCCKRSYRVFVGVPVRHVLAAGHVTYLVTTQLREELPGYTRGKKFAVRRRFREFVALASVLKVSVVWHHDHTSLLCMLCNLRLQTDHE